MPNEFQVSRNIIVLGFCALILLTLFTHYYGSTDLGDYSDTAKYFAGTYAADIRSSHSYLYGFIHAPLVGLFHSFIVFKITSLVLLFLLIYSVYRITGRDKRALALMVFSPVVWYMAPWINPIQGASLCLVWAYYFIERYDRTNSLRSLIYTATCIGLGLALWDTILFFGSFMLIPYLWNKKSYHVVIALTAIGVGLLPRLLLDTYLFGFPFFSLLKSFVGTLTNALFLGRGTTYISTLYANLVFFILIFLSIPLYFWNACSQRSFRRTHVKTLVFLFLSLALIIINPQIRYTLVLIPIMTILMVPTLSPVQWKRQLVVSLCITLLFIAPILVQTTYSINESNFYDITEVLVNAPHITLTRLSESTLLQEDLANVERDFPYQKFIVFGKADYYQKLAHLYWGTQITKLVSIQDYELWQQNASTLFEKKLTFIPRINDRRAIWIGGGIIKNPNDATDYDSLVYGISLDEDPHDPRFVLVKRYQRLAVWSMQRLPSNSLTDQETNT